jgi:hypothetical protein
LTYATPIILSSRYTGNANIEDEEEYEDEYEPGAMLLDFVLVVVLVLVF